MCSSDLGDQVICPTGQIVTLTSMDAEQKVGPDQRPLLSEGTVDDLSALLQRIGLEDAPLVQVRITTAERIARVIDGFPVSGILLALGLLALYVEFKTPGFGWPGLTGILLLAVWFWGHHIAGLAGMGEILLFMVGVALLAVEIFVTPGFGTLGVFGIAAMLAAIVMAMVQHLPEGPWYRLPDWHVRKAIYNLAVSAAVAGGIGALLVRWLPKTGWFRRLALDTAVGSAEGYSAATPAASLVGLSGIAVTPLHPAGIAVFGPRRLDVVTRGEFIPANTPIVIAQIDGNRIIVEAKSETIAV